MPYWIYLIIAGLAFAAAALSGFYFIPLFKKLSFGATIYEKGPAWQKSKNGTPLMGGFMFILGTLLACAAGYGIFRSRNADADLNGLLKLLAGIVFALLNGVIGFIDDYIKAVKKRNLGLRAREKTVMQIAIDIAFMAALYLLGDTSTSITFPFFGEVNFGIFYYPIMVVFLYYLTNAVNITDGVDGLCGTVTTVFSIIYLTVFLSAHMWEYSIFAAALAGGCMGFLVWNLNPAKIFMGDTGSMFLGGCVCAFGFITHQHLLLALIAIVYICEALSVVLQVISFKTTGKRIFKMSPIHHHFEMCGFSEYKIVISFSSVGLIFGVLGAVLFNIYLK
ncbi:MAG: phospho-N-acetylmuramoyl-pentapeptide-transferase [Huintestinicola sp.]